ncbi:MAG: response regulator transcription factor [Ignavibacteria bacterium]|nr:response regulator transcription factor [Ignavibacteria bacterium]
MSKAGKNVTVLVADGHEEIREAMCEYLNRIQGIHVVAEALNGFEVIAKVERLKPDIVLLDVALPGLNGIETARIVKRRFASTKVYLSTLFDEALYEKEAHRVGAEGIISKSQLKRGLTSLLRDAQRQASQ